MTDRAAGCSCPAGQDCACGAASTREAYPWDKCISDQLDKGYSQESASKICGYIKAKYGSGGRAAARAADLTMRRSYPIPDGGVDRVNRKLTVIASTNAPLPTTVMRDGQPDEVPLALESWDLTRATNGLVPVLWAHDSDSMPIAKMVGAEDTADGLAVTMQFPEGFKRSDEVWRAIDAGLVRGISVGFGPGDDTFEERDGQVVGTRRNAQLLEVSVVPVPMDPKAMIAPSPRALSADERKAQASRAASTLAKAKQARTDAGDGTETVRRFDAVRLSKFERTQVGGLRIPARLARTGVLVYRNADGTTRRELRLPEDVFRKDSLDTLRSAPVTDLAHHRDMVTTETWKDATLGHVESVRQDSSFVAADVVINDARTIADVEAGRLSDVSAGYRCRLDWTSGMHDGEHYDCIQRDITYNHVAVLPPGRGRAGTAVGLRLDSNDAESVIDEEPIMKVIRIDGKDVEYGSEQHVSHIEKERDAAQARCDAAEAEHKKATDALEAKFDAADAELKKVKADLAAATDPKAIDARVTARASLLTTASAACGSEFKSDGLSDREIRIAVIRTDSAFKDFDGKDKSDDYVAALYDSVSSRVTRKDGVDSVVDKIRTYQQRSDAGESPEAKARAEMEKRNRERASQPIGVHR